MSTTLPTRQQVDRAEPLEFADRQPETTITIRAQLDGWPVDVAYRGKLEQLPAAIARMQAAGLAPATNPPEAHQKPAAARKGKTQPEYSPSGDPCCPIHKRPLKQGQYGLYCSAKDDSDTSRNGYCGLRFSE